MKNTLPLLCILFCSVFLSVNGQSVTRGISNGQITIIEMGGNGDVWVGVSDSLVVHYSSNLSYLGQYSVAGTVNAIALGGNNSAQNAFVGTSAGLSNIKNGNLYNAAGSVLPQANVSSLVYKIDSGLLYTFTPSAGGVVLDTSMQFHNSVNLPFSKISCSYWSGCGAGYIVGSVDSGIFYSHDMITDTLVQAPNLVSDSVTAVYIVNNCNARLVGTRHGFSFCPLGHPCQNYTRSSTSGALPQDHITAITQDCKGNIWLGMADSGVVQFTPPTQSFTRVNLPAGDGQITALATLADSCQGTIYVGSASGDLLMLDTSKAVIQVINTAVQNVQENQLSVKVFPQPASAMLNFLFGNTIENGQFSFTDLTGRMLGTYDVKNAGRLALDVSSIANGLYIYHVISNGQLVSTGKFEVIK